MVLTSFVTFLGLFLLVGLSSARRSRPTRRDYYLASQDISPLAAGLSAVATNNSGYMFIGVIGYTYVTGLAAIWLMVGWIVGDMVASLFIHRRLRDATGATHETTFLAVLSGWYGNNFGLFRRVAALVTIIFLGAYAAAQMDAGGKALHAMFGWSDEAGAVAVGVIVIAYCLAGGIRASIWTDVAQASVMLIAMGTLLFTAISDMGGRSAAWAALDAIPGYMDLAPPADNLLASGASGIALFALGWLFAGFSVAGQPHVMVRFMALDSAGHMPAARFVYYLFFTLFYACATGVGLLSRIYLPELGSIDPELALPRMADQLLAPVWVGLILAGIFAATMSTADSLVLSCSSALTNDLPARPVQSMVATKSATVLFTIFAVVLAVTDQQSVFDLVILAWSCLASAFAPLALVYALRGKPSEFQALLMMVVGVGTALWWRHQGWHDLIYEGMPGILAGLATYGLTQGAWRGAERAARTRL
ncbi:MAG: sodium/proline symporter [Gammaproteobacteria bacterium]